MRVEINTKNDNELYAKRWEQINKAYRLANGYTDSSISIVNSLAEYYAKLDQIKLLDNGRFLLMPIDEEPIFVDTNSRKLKVPSYFVQNGISVQGDHYGEMVMFKMPRYFDHYDLANFHIHINWELTGSDKRQVISSGRSAAEHIDQILDPNYIIFGWYITSKMTVQRGYLRFSVTVSTSNLINTEINIDDDDDYDLGTGFKLNTMPATLSVVEGLPLGDVEILTKAEQDIVLNQIIQNSIYTLDELPPLISPVVLEPKLNHYTNINYVNGASDEITLIAQAYSEDLQSNVTASINYKWTGPQGVIPETIGYYEINDANEIPFSGEINYYEYDEDNTVYKVKPIADSAEYAEFLENNSLFTRYSSITASEVGNYSCNIDVSAEALVGDPAVYTTYHSLPTYVNTTIPEPSKPFAQWQPSTQMDNQYIEETNNGWILYLDDNGLTPKNIKLDGQIKTLTTTVLNQETVLDLTNADNLDYFGAASYGIVNPNNINNFVDNTIATSATNITNTTKQTIEIKTVTDGAYIVPGIKHKKNNKNWEDDEEHSVVQYTDKVFQTYYMPTDISNAKFLIGALTDGHLDVNDVSITPELSTINLQLKTEAVSGDSSDTFDYNWPTNTHGTYSYDWQYKIKNNASDPSNDEGYVSFSSKNGNSSIQLTMNDFPGTDEISQYYVRVIITNTNGNKTSSCVCGNTYGSKTGALPIYIWRVS